MLAVLHNLKMPLRSKDCQIRYIYKTLYQARYQNFLGGGRCQKRKIWKTECLLKTCSCKNTKIKYLIHLFLYFYYLFFCVFFFWLCFISLGLTFNIQNQYHFQFGHISIQTFLLNGMIKFSQNASFMRGINTLQSLKVKVTKYEY